MEIQQQPQEGPQTNTKGPIQKMIDWTLAITFCGTLVALWIRYIIEPLIWWK